MGGPYCTAAWYEVGSCSEPDPSKGGQDCKFGAWSTWSGCDEKTPNQRFRERDIVQSAELGGKQCEGNRGQTKPCGPGEDCTFGEWGSWAGCNATNPKQRARERVITHFITGTQADGRC